MRLNRIIAFLMAFLTLGLSFLVHIKYIHLQGFPDGFISELGYTERKLAYVFMGIILILGSGFIYLGMIATQTKIAKRLTITIILYLVSSMVIFLTSYYYRLYLVGNGGG